LQHKRSEHYLRFRGKVAFDAMPLPAREDQHLTIRAVHIPRTVLVLTLVNVRPRQNI
jgi:hypothetical protein